MIPDHLVKKFQWAVKKDHGEDLKFEDAEQILAGLTRYFDLLADLYHQIKTGDYDEGKTELSELALWKKKEEEQIEKIKKAKTGEPITLSGYVVYDKDGNDTGKRFIHKEDAENYAKLLKEENL